MRRLLTFGIVGFLAQLVDGAMGMGFGTTSTSLLVATGTAAAVASATVHLAEMGTTLVSGVAHHRFGNVDWPTLRRLALPGAVGAFAGATVLSNLDLEVAAPLVAVILAGLGVNVIVRSRRDHSPVDPGAAPHGRRFLGGLGLAGGFLDAAGGGGWGAVGTSSLMTGRRMEPRKVIGTVSASEFLVSAGASAGFLLAMPWSLIDPWLIVAILIGGSVAAPASAWLVHHLDHRTLGTLVGVVLVATNLRTIAKSAGASGDAITIAGGVVLVAWLASVAWLGVGLIRHRRRPGEVDPAVVTIDA